MIIPGVFLTAAPPSVEIDRSAADLISPECEPQAGVKVLLVLDMMADWVFSFSFFFFTCNGIGGRVLGPVSWVIVRIFGFDLMCKVIGRMSFAFEFRFLGFCCRCLGQGDRARSFLYTVRFFHFHLTRLMYIMFD